MKKILTVFSAMLFTSAFSQCVINGNSEIRMGTTSNYTIQNNQSQCGNCHLWENKGSVASLNGDVRKSSIRVRGNTPGTMTLQHTALTLQGVTECSKTINIVDGTGIRVNSNASSTGVSNSNASSNCDIVFDNYVEVKNSDGLVSFRPEVQNSRYKYEWTATYANGEQKTSTADIPNFSYTGDNGISSVAVKITSPSCIKNFNKKYNSTYWKTF
ncbi:hypothetical protein MTP09_03265 [Chryseobacterium suipulveris]|uniref:Lipoprotein n=1 Tax=Chryseobacterium suipulveris TaxID=2929800 RepID=A0ABY4BR45_9FLAO|nr:hypothetical protein [Chryseobacterium suipulveris]UOE41673.1 hypothetical protein MTP09_03265 [Chryseobacterium suipulveris]